MPQDKHTWTDEEVDFLKQNYPKYGSVYCSEILGISKKAVSAKAVKLKIKSKAIPKKYEMDSFSKVVSESKSYREVAISLGLSALCGNRQTVKRYIKKYKIDISHFTFGAGVVKAKNKYTLDEILIVNSPYRSIKGVKEKLFSAGLKERKCEKCGQDEIWHGEKLSLILDHKNGINDDHRFENLWILCPNCSATLPTHCKGNIEEYNKRLVLKNSLAGQVEKSLCVCGNEKEKRAKLCRDCYDKKPKGKVPRPSYETLIKETSENGFVATGKKYGVSDNAVRKWIKKYENK